jgi:hypothetical protein
VLDTNGFADEQDQGCVSGGVRTGALSVSALQGPDGLCQSASASPVLTDVKVVAGRHASLVFEFRVKGAAGSGLGDTGSGLSARAACQPVARLLKTAAPGARRPRAGSG